VGHSGHSTHNESSGSSGIAERADTPTSTSPASQKLLAEYFKHHARTTGAATSGGVGGAVAASAPPIESTLDSADVTSINLDHNLTLSSILAPKWALKNFERI
jgi:hypothetical protein